MVSQSTMLKSSSFVPDTILSNGNTVNKAGKVPVLRELTLGETDRKYTKKDPTFQMGTVLRKKQNGVQRMRVLRRRSGSYCFLQGGWRRVQ